MANKVFEILVRSRRLAILRFLSEGPGYELNTSVLQTALDMAGLNASRDTVEGDCAWLAEQGLVDVQAIEGTSIMVARLLSRGLDVSRGIITQPGVDRPLNH